MEKEEKQKLFEKVAELLFQAGLFNDAEQLRIKEEMIQKKEVCDGKKSCNL